jgi:hypothetical protein
MVDKPWQRVLGSLALAIAAILGSIATVATLAHHDRYRHAGQHGALFLGALVLLASALFLWPQPRGGAEVWLRRVLLLGLASLLAGNLLEGIGAYGYALDDGYVVVNQPLREVHNVGIIFTPIGMLALLIGLLGTLSTRVRLRMKRRSAS